MGFQTESTKKGTCKYCLKRRKRGIQKRAKVVVDNLPKGFTAVSLDESFFLFDSLVRKVWIYKNTRPVVRITGSHQQSYLFGAISLDGRQLFRQYSCFNEDTFYKFLKQIHHKFPKCYLFLDKAPQHYKSHKVRIYFEESNDILVLRYYKSFSDFMVKIGQYFRTRHFKFNMRKYLTGYVS